MSNWNNGRDNRGDWDDRNNDYDWDRRRNDWDDDWKKGKSGKGRSGDDTLIGGSGNDYLNGERGDDLILGNDGNDYLEGGQGNDTLLGGTGNDKLVGGQGEDLLVAGDGGDRLDGGQGDDTLEGGSGIDFLEGGQGNDRLIAGGGADLADGGSGFDTAVYAGSVFDYQVRDLFRDTTLVRDLRAGSPDGVDLLHDVEALQFSDHLVYIDGRNNVPIAGTDLVVGTGGEQSVIPLATLLANDVDFDGDRLKITAVGNALNGTVHLDGQGNVVFTPAPDFSGEASFTYSVSDGHGGTASGLVKVDVQPGSGNHAPDAVDDTAETSEDTAVTIAIADLLANDTDPDAGDTKTFVSAQGAVNGTVTVSGGDIIFTPDENYGGPASFTYTIKDSAGATDTATVRVNVTSVNDAPVTGSDQYEVDEDTLLTIAAPGVLANDFDVEGGQLTVANAGSFLSELGAEVTLNANGSFTYDPTVSGFLQELDEGTFTPDEFTYEVSDGNGGTTTQTVAIVVHGRDDGANTPPVPEDDTFAIPGAVDDITFINAGNVLANDVDADDDLLSAVPRAFETEYGELQLAEDGELDLLIGGSGTPETPTPADRIRMLQEGDEVEVTTDVDDAPLSYEVTDGDDTAVASLRLIFVGENDAPVIIEPNRSYDVEQGGTLVLEDFIAGHAFDWDDALEALTLTTFGAQESTSNVTFDEESGALTYTPGADFTGEDSIFYQVADGHGGSSEGTLLISVGSSGLLGSLAQDVPLIA